MTRIMLVGLGEIGRAVAGAMLLRGKHTQLVAAVDANPQLHGKTVRDVLNDAGAPKVCIEATVAGALRKLKGPPPEVAIVSTGSRVEQVQATLREIISAGIHVVSSCEELSFPLLRSPKAAAELDALAVRQHVAILGTGVNPGFAMDGFALTCTAPCTVVRSIKVLRSLDASKRRHQLQKKIGAGMDLAECKKLIRQHKIGHVGLAESVALIARALGWKLDRIEEKFEPVVADHLFFNEHFRVEPGQVRGMRMRGFGRMGRKTPIELDLTMAFDVDTYDEVIIDGEPPLLVRTKSGFPGDACTVNMLLNCAHTVGQLRPGVRTMLDVLQVHSVGA